MENRDRFNPFRCKFGSANHNPGYAEYDVDAGASLLRANISLHCYI